MIEDFEERWRAILAEGVAATREVDASSPMRMIFGADGLGRPLFFVVVNRKPGIPHLAGAVSVERRFREHDDTWTLSLVLSHDSLREVFIALVVDLAYRCANAPDEAKALARLLDTVEQWQALLEERFDRLSEKRLRGVMAELWFGFRSNHHGFAHADTVASWSGPYGGYQDFMFPAPAAQYEVKAVRPSSNSVEINSERQLDGSPIHLVAITVDRTDPDTGWSLPRLVDTIRTALAEPETRIEFNRALVELRVNLDDPWYADQVFAFRRMRVFDAVPAFPAIRRSELPPVISRVEYHLSLEGLDDFLVLDRDVTDPFERASDEA